MKKLAILAVLASAFLSTSLAYADGITTPGTGPVLLDAANGTPPSSVTLAATILTVAPGGQFLQQLSFFSGYDGTGGPLPFSFSEIFTINGTLGSYLFTGTFNVSPTADPDTITFNAGAPTRIDGDILTLRTLSFPDSPPYPGGVVTQTLTFDLTRAAPEPGSLMLLGTGVLAAAGAFRRRIFA